MKKLLLLFIPILLSWNTTNAQTALDFNGTNYVDCATTFSSLDNYTLEAKIYYKGGVGTRWLLNFSNGTPNERLQLEINGGQLFSYNQSSTSATSGFAGGSILINTWYHVAITNDNITGKKLYIDGILVASNASTVSPSEMPGPINFNIGRIPGLSNYFNGTVDQFRCWNYARSASELLASKDSCMTGTESGLVALYNFEEGAGSVVNDLAGGDNNGTLVNAPTWVAGYACTAFAPCIANQTVTATQSSFFCSGSTTIDLGSSEVGVNYFLRDDLDGTIVDGPIAGTGSGISLNTGVISTTTSYNVYGNTGKQDNAIDLPATNDYVRFNSPFFAYGNEITVEAWVNYQSGAMVWAGQSTASVDNMSQNVWLWHSGNFYVNDNGTWRGASMPALPVGWTHVATVADATSLRVYYNGVLQTTGPGISSGIRNTAGSIIDLGQDPRFPSNAGRNSDVSFGNFRVWNSARTIGDISGDMNSCLTGSEPNLQQLTWLDEGTGTSLFSLKGSAGTLINPSTNWITGNGICGSASGCSLQMTQTQVVTIDTIANQTVTAVTLAFCDSGSTTIDLGSSETGIDYYLRDDADSSIVDGPVAGNGSGISLNTGTINTTTTYNVYGVANLDKALDFDGVDDYVATTLSLGSGYMAIEAWVYINSLTGNATIVDEGENYRLWIDASGAIHLGVNGGGLFEAVTDPLINPVTLGTWTHIAVSYDGMAMQAWFYLDGVQIGPINVTYLIPSEPAALLSIGGVTNGSVYGGFFDGKIDDVRIWASSIDSTQIVNNMNSCLVGNEPNLFAYFKFSEGSGLILENSVTSNNDGTLTNMDINLSWTGGKGNCGSGVPCELEMATIATVTVNASTTGVDPHVACDSYTWIDANTYTASNNTATYTLTNAAGCDSIVTLDLTIRYSNTGTDIQVACDTYTWGLNSTTYTASTNTPMVTLTNMNNCDSIVTLNLTINNSNAGTDVQVACDSYIWPLNSTTYTTSTNAPTVTLTNAAGCDSVVTLDLTINTLPVITAQSGNIISCGDNSALVYVNSTGNNTYQWYYDYTPSPGSPSMIDGSDTEINFDTDSMTIQSLVVGNYNDYFVYCTITDAVTGCTINSSNDSISVLDPSAGTDVQVACDSYTWLLNSTTYTSNNNTATATLTNAAGCDSIVTLDLTINTSNTGTDVQIACTGYIWIDGNTYTTSNNIATYTYVNGSVNGCDSIVTFDLTIDNIDLTVTNTAPTLTANQIGASYEWIDCSTGFAVLPPETNQSFTATVNGDYGVVVTIGSCSDTSACVNISTVGISPLSMGEGSGVRIYPNPTNGLFTISLSNQQGEVNYTITTLEGRIVKQANNVTANNIDVDLSNESKGIYLLRINEANTNKVYKIVKQ